MHTIETTDALSQQIETLENELVEKQKELAKLRRSVPKTEVKDYEFTDLNGNKVKLSDMFEGKNELLVVHNMGKSCRYCTLWADEYNGIVNHLENRVPFYVTSPDDWQTAKEFASSRDWKFKLLSTLGNTFKPDMGFEPKEGDYQPGFSTFERGGDGKIYHTAKAGFGPGDLYCSLWHYFALLPKGNNKWEPKYTYK